MIYYSTNNVNNTTSFKTAVIKGLADDGGLYMPLNIPQIDNSFINKLKNKSFKEIAFEISKLFIEDDLQTDELRKIINNAFNFETPLINLSDQINVLELFHGPTLAFKDYGARFMAAVISHYNRDSNKELKVLVATSGDTGSAVAGGFYKREGIKVYLLYPQGMVSEIQEKQLTTWGENITALEINGNFDDCQKLVKSAFVDVDLNNKLNLTSANSISIARMLPQIFYYFEAYKQLKDIIKDIYVCVPSGNLGNLTAGLFSSAMGLPIRRFISATNTNSVFTDYLNTGKFKPREVIPTLSNAMDVGNPSNLVRIDKMHNNELKKIQNNIYSASFNDQQTIEAIKEVYKKYNYVMDPHGAVGYLAIKKYFGEYDIKNSTGIILETAHPAKFIDTVKRAIEKEIEIPERLAQCISKEKISTQLPNDYSSLKDYLLSQ